MFEAFRIGVAIHLTNHVSPVLTKLTTEFARTGAEAAAFQKRLEGIKSTMIGGIFAVGAGLGIASLFKTPIEDALKFERAMLRLQSIGGITQATLQRVRSQALDGTYKGIGSTESVDLFRDLHAAFGSAEEAQKFMPQFATLARVTQGTFGKSAVGGEEDVRALAKFAERRGGTKDSASMAAALDLAMQIQNASGGAVTPKDLLAFTARMGSMGAGLSNQGILGMWALMQEQGGSKAGTALNSAMQNLVNGRGTEKAGYWLHSLGLVDEKQNSSMLSRLYGANAGQHRNAVTADSLVGAGLMREDPVTWVQKYLVPAATAFAVKEGITDPRKQSAEITKIVSMALSNRLGADSIALIATQLPRILKDRGIAEGSGGLDSSAGKFDASPVSTFQALAAKWETALVNLGEHALPVVVPLVEKLTSLLQRFVDYSSKNPGSVERWVKGIAALSAALIGFGAFAMFASGINAVVLASKLAVTAIGALGAGTGLAGALGMGGKAGLVGAAALASVAIYSLGSALVQLYDATHREGVKLTPYAQSRMNDPDFKALPDPFHGVNTIAPSWSQPTPIHTTVQIDGRNVAYALTHYQAKEVMRPQTGMSRYDWNLGMAPAGGG